MPLSRQARIITLLVIDSTFFVLEIVVGVAVGSLALMADSFHMLNDVCSLIVALYAIKLAAKEHSSNTLTYGWQRAEILGALINGVFLLALCFTIFIEAIERLFNVTEVQSPMLVVIVGALGLLSNIIGLFLFHEHGHSHGGGHSHSHGVESAAEEGHAHEHLPAAQPTAIKGADETSALIARRSSDASDTAASYAELFVHPAQTRANVVRAAHDAGYGSFSPGPSGAPRSRQNSRNHERTPSRTSIEEDATRRRRGASAPPAPDDASRRLSTVLDEDAGHAHDDDHDHAHSNGHSHAHDDKHDHSGHSHSHGGGGGHGHDHGSMNMRGVFLHVLGDALGNVGVIVSGLFIWLTQYSWRFYTDPAVSFLITIIIAASALPLACYILLQATPSHVPLEEVRGAILRVPGVVDVHELHVWSLSESKLVGSVHVLIKSTDDHVAVSHDVRELLHKFGIHSSTIQPEVLGEHTALPPDVGDVSGTLSCPVICAPSCDA